MKEKIAYLMKSEGLTTTRLAEILEVQPSAVSHFVSGRNKPGFDVLQRILRGFPKINPDWLLLDRGEPYRADVEEEDLSADDTLNDRENGVQISFGDSSSEKGCDSDLQEVEFNKMPFSAIKSGKTSNSSVKNPIFVVVFYDDGSCENFSMR